MAKLVRVRSLRRRGDVTVVDSAGNRKTLRNDQDTILDLDRADNRRALSRVWSDVTVSGVIGTQSESFTVATRPAAGDVPAGTIVFVSDAAAGANFQGSTGAAWVNLG